MYRWITRVVNIGGGTKSPEEEFIHTVSRPFVSTGDGMMRVASYGNEKWFRLPVQKVEISETAEQGLLEILDGKDIDQLIERASEFTQSENPDDIVIGHILIAAVRHYRACLQVKAESEEGGSNGSSEQG